MRAPLDQNLPLPRPIYPLTTQNQASKVPPPHLDTSLVGLPTTPPTFTPNRSPTSPTDSNTLAYQTYRLPRPSKYPLHPSLSPPTTMIVNLIGLLTHTVAPPPTPLAPNPTPSFSLDGSWSIQDQNQPNYTRKFTYKFFEPFPAEKCPCIDPIDPNDPSPPSIRFAPLEDPTDPTPETEPKTAAGAETQPPTDAITSNSISSASSVTSATTSTPFKPTSTPLVSSTETSPDASPLHDGDSALGNGKEEKDEEKAKHCVTPKVVEELVTEMEGTTQETTLETTLETTQEKTQEKTTQGK